MFSVEDYWRIFVYRLYTAIEAYVPVKRIPLMPGIRKRKHILKTLDKCSVVKVYIGSDGVRLKILAISKLIKHTMVKWSKAVKAYYRDLETALVQSDKLETFYRYVNGKLSGRKSIPPIKDAAGNFIRDYVSRTNIFNKYFASVFTRDDNNTAFYSACRPYCWML